MYNIVMAPGRAFGSPQESEARSWLECAFDRDPVAKFVLSPDGQVLDSNRAANALIDDDVLSITRGALRFGSPDSNAAVQSALRKIERSPLLTLRILLRDRAGQWRAADIYKAGRSGAVFLTMRAGGESSDEALEALRANFALSATESKVLEKLVSGDCAKDVARRLEVSEHTVRTHMRAIYAKLGVRGLTGALRFALQLVA